MNRWLPALIAVLTCSATSLWANIGEDAEGVVKRFGKPDRTEIVHGGKKMWWRSVQQYEVTVWLMSRNDKVLSVREDYRKAGSRVLERDLAKNILKSYSEAKQEWKMIKTSRHTPPGSMLQTKVTHFTSPDGAFAVYCEDINGSALAAENRGSAYLVFLDAVAYQEFSKSMGKDLEKPIVEAGM